MIKDNYFLRLYVYTSYADCKRSVSDRWLRNGNDKEAQSALNISILPFFHFSILLGGEQAAYVSCCKKSMFKVAG